MKTSILCFALVISVCVARGDNSKAPLIVHEWGTFTSLQDEQGNAIGGINTDDEPVPAFVHRLGFRLIAPQRMASVDGAPVANSRMKIAPVTHCDPDVLARLETPVIYFYPPADWKPQPVNVHVAYPGGWLSEFYPDAVSKAPGFLNNWNTVGHLDKNAIGELSWTGLVLGGQGTGPQTDSKVWLAPRDVKSTQVTAAGGESEKFLFYRGVANVEAPVRVSRNTGGDLEIRDRNSNQQPTAGPEATRISAAWLVDVRADGVCAVRSLGAMEPREGVRATMPGAFTQGEYLAGNLARLRGEMRVALIDQGLYADEADALLNTWQVSYFRSPGLRFFYMCPRAQIDSALPLEVSVRSRVSRVTIGRIEIVTPAQRALLKEIASGAPVKKMVQDYADLGRFRNALVLDEQKSRPTAALNDFINRNDLGLYTFNNPAPASGIGKTTAAFLAAFTAVYALKFFRKTA